MPEIVYTNRHLVSEHGVKPIKVSDEFAKRMVQRGFARVIDSDPNTNPPIALPQHPINNIPKEEVFSEEQNLYTFVSWIESGHMSRMIMDTGDDCGFHIRRVSGGPHDVSHMMLSDIVVINIGDIDWQYDFKYSLRVVLFQRLVPFVVRWHNACEELLLVRQLMTRARLNIFDNEQLIEDVKGTVGDLMCPYIVYRDPYNFWREISRVCL